MEGGQLIDNHKHKQKKEGRGAKEKKKDLKAKKEGSRKERHNNRAFSVANVVRTQRSIQRNLDPDLVLAVIQIESAFNRFAISVVGAQGLMQVMPFWRLEIGRPQDNLTDVETSIRYGTVILAHYLDVAKGDLVDALARYNGSRGRLKYPEKVIKAWRTRWRNKTREDLPMLQASCANYGLNACRYQ